MDVNVDVNADVNSVAADVNDVGESAPPRPGGLEYTPHKNVAVPDGMEEPPPALDHVPDQLPGDGVQHNSTDIQSADIGTVREDEPGQSAVQEETKADRADEEPRPIDEEPIECVHSQREHAPPPPARARTSSGSSSGSSSSSDSERKDRKREEVSEEAKSSPPEVVEEPIFSVDRKDIEAEKGGSFVSAPAAEAERTVETAESSEVTASKEVIESDDAIQVKITERKVTSLQEVEELVKEYPLDDAVSAKPVEAEGGEVIFTKEVRVVEDFTTVHTKREVHAGGVVKTEETVQEQIIKEETEVGDQKPEEPAHLQEVAVSDADVKREEPQEASSSDRETEETDEGRTSPSKSKKDRFFEFFKRKPQKDKEQPEEQGVKEDQSETKDTEAAKEPKEEEPAKSEEKQTPEKKKRHFLIFKKADSKERNQKDRENEDLDKAEQENKEEDEDKEKDKEGEETKSEEGELETNNKSEKDTKEKGEKKRKYHFFQFKRSEPKEQGDKEDLPEGSEKGDKEVEQEEVNTESKSVDEEKDTKNTPEKKKYHFFAFRRSEQKDEQPKTKDEGSAEEKEQEAKEEDTADSKSEDTDNKSTLERKKKHHFFIFHKSDNKEPAEDKNTKEEEQAAENKEEDKANTTPNKNTLERKKLGFFHFKKSEPKEAEEETDQPEESGVKQTPEKKKLGLFKVFPSGKDKKDKKERVTVEQKEEGDEEPGKESPKEGNLEKSELVQVSESSPKNMDGCSPEETERLEIFKTGQRPKSFILGDERPMPVSATPTHSAASPSSGTAATRPSPQPSTSQLVTPLHSSADLDGSLDAAVARPPSETSASGRITPGTAHGPGHFVVVAIDFGTTFSGYAFSFTRDPDSIHMMRKWEGGDPGVINQKTPTCLLLHPDGKFHSFGFTARDFFHDLDPQESKKWMFFDKFKMTLHYNAELNKDTMIKASNGKLMPAMSIFTHALRFFKEHALQELSDQSSTKILNEDVRWVITVPAIWKAAAKQFMRQAAYNAGIAAPEYPDQLLIALEPEAASIYVRRLRMHQLVPERHAYKTLSPRKEGTPEPMNMDKVCDEMRNGTRYIVVDCGGGTVDITVHEMESKYGNLHELYKATGGPYGSVGVDIEFEKLLVDIFGSDFMEAFKYKRPAGFVDLMIAFESRKRAATPYKNNPLNVSLPFSFIDYHKKFRNSQVESAIRKYGDKEIRWSSQGMLRLSPEAMRRLFQPTLDRIKQSVGDVLNNPAVKDIRYMFLVGGFSESQILQHELRREFGHLLRIIIPQDVSLTILKGAVCFGMDPTVVKLRKSRMTYGVGVLNRFVPGKHPPSKLVRKDGVDWCTDVFDKFVVTDQSVALGDTTLRSYTPAKAGQKTSIINIYSSDRNDCEFTTDRSVERVGSLCLDLSHFQYGQTLPRRREIQTRMIFGDTEIKVTALDVATGKCVRAAIDFLSK